MNIKKLSLYYHTLKHLKSTQFVYRVKNTLNYKASSSLSGYIHWKYKKVIDDASKSAFKSNAKFFKGYIQLNPNILERYHFSFEVTDRILRKNFKFLNYNKTYEQDIEWKDSNVPKLWLYNLHYMDYIKDLAIAYQVSKEQEYLNKYKKIIRSWIDSNEVGKGDGWEPYTLSLRTVNLVKSYLILKEQLIKDDEFIRLFKESLYTQFAFLFRNLEFHLYGNHLMENIRSLIYGGLLFEGKEPKKWLEKGYQLYVQQMREQFLEDGGHFERSPMYHLIMLENTTETYLLLENNKFNVPEDIKQRLKNGYNFALDILHPDNNISIFNDAAFGIAKKPEEILPVGGYLFSIEEIKARFPIGSLNLYLLMGTQDDRISEIETKAVSTVQYSQTGYYMMTDQNSKMIIDCGEVGPDYNPGHAHSDTLSYELSYENNRWIVDSGTFEYAGNHRHSFRTTEAHNTVKIDGVDQSEVWSTFRVGKRAKPIDAKLEQKNDHAIFIGEHDGYKRLADPLIHQRSIVNKDNAYLILDTFRCDSNHQFDSFIQLHPSIDVKYKNNYLETTDGLRYIYIIPFYMKEQVLIDSEYSDEFGLKYSNKRIKFSGDTSYSKETGYILFKSDSIINNLNLSINESGNEKEIQLLTDGGLIWSHTFSMVGELN
ncbi:alginate lyase family protein [Aquibacillus sediminis]|uniref:alginate lyase family protein n=1 Tax=Aquibacillus sediminis TaxID=2574734 RepID=UPI001486C76C|nr:alginate lyase family protein [Aquibacillus sediminis]